MWRATLDQAPEVVSVLEALLSKPERERADRIPSGSLRNRYIVARGLLRTLLARYEGARAEDLEFSYGPHGKPFVKRARTRFNLSHSGHAALFAFSSSADVGVDVELADRQAASLQIAERFFSPAEARALRALPKQHRPRAFLSCWTRKEAFLKARGDGLSLPLNSFHVSLAPSQPPAVLRTSWSATEPAQWRLEDLSDPGGETVAAVAARHLDWRVVNRSVSDLLSEGSVGAPRESA